MFDSVFDSIRRALRPRPRPRVADLSPATLSPDACLMIAGRHASDGIVLQRVQGEILWANDAYCQMTGRKLDEILGLNPLSFALPEDMRPSDEDIAAFRYSHDNAIYQRLGLQDDVPIRNVRKSGEIFWIQISTSWYTDPDGQEFVVLVCRDATVQQNKEIALQELSEKLETAATHDALTGAANRTGLERFISKLETDTPTAPIAFFQIDLDHFKEINDSHGHTAGDAVLRHAVGQMRATLRTDDLIARMGGDEFVVVCPYVHNPDALHDIGQSLVRSLRIPADYHGSELQYSASIGATLSHETGLDLAALLQRSDFALYDVKRRGRDGVIVYDGELHQQQIYKTQRRQLLREAVLANQLEFRYQATQHARQQHIRGFETLAYWHHPKEGLVHYKDFEAEAHAANVVAQIDFQAMAAAAKLRARLKSEGFDGIRVGFNCSDATLEHHKFIEALDDTLTRNGLPVGDLVIELPEATIFGDLGRRREKINIIQTLNDVGYAILLDHFGAGYAGLPHLGQLAVSGFKIDSALTRQIDTDPITLRIVETIVQISTDLGLYAVAEGVCTNEQVRLFQGVGGQVVQGPLVTEPLDFDAVVPWLRLQARNSVASGTLSRPA